MVLFVIHHEDKYKEDSDKPNIAKILVRNTEMVLREKIELYFDAKKTTFLNIEKSQYAGTSEDFEAF